jgi:hypothetical protein
MNDRRIGKDRRNVKNVPKALKWHGKDWRSGAGRRSGNVRRLIADRRIAKERRNPADRRKINIPVAVERRSGKDRRAFSDRRRCQRRNGNNQSHKSTGILKRMLEYYWG